MKLYKFRALSNFKYVMDIVVHERLYCADIESLNDPFEGLFFQMMNIPPHKGGLATAGSGFSSRLRTVSKAKDWPQLEKYRVSSLSANMEDVRLWSHYAEGHTGVAIELEIDETEGNLHKVKYLEELPEKSVSLLTILEKSLLTNKTTHWSHENEYRIITDTSFFSVKGCITAVYSGIRTCSEDKELLSQVLPKEIPLIETELKADTITIKPKRRD